MIHQEILIPITLPKRFLSYCIDAIITWIPSSFLLFILDKNPQSQLLWIIVYSIYIFIGDTGNGTLGKKVFKLLIVTLDGEKPSKEILIKRAILKTINIFSLKCLLIGQTTFGVESQPILNLIVITAAILNVYYYNKGYCQSIHDYFSKTTIVKK